MHPTWSAALLLATVAVAGCTTEQQSTPAPTLTSTTSTTTVPDDSTTTVPPATPATSETTVAAPTTTVPTGPTSALVPLLVGRAEDPGWLFLGAWQEGSWQPATTPDDQPIRPGVEVGATFALSNLDGRSDAASGAEVTACADGRIGPSFDTAVAPPDPPGSGYSTIAVLAPTWDLTPRPVAVDARAPESYRALGQAGFGGTTVDATPGEFRQLVITDLDGDGDDEALGAFEYVQQDTGPGAPGDLAALVLIDPVTRNVSPVARSFVAPDAAPDEMPLLERFRVLDVADLNGDGRTEVIVRSWSSERASVTVYTYDGATLTEVLATGCDG